MPSWTANLKSLLEAVPGALVGVDRGGVIRYVNRQAESLFGYDGDGLVGEPIEILVPESARPGHPAHREAYFAGPGTRRPAPERKAAAAQKAAASPRCLRGRKRDGTEFPLNLSLSQIDTDDGPLVIAAVRDLTAREKANDRRDQASRLAAIVEDSDDAIIGKTLEGVITSWNPAAERMYGYTGQQIVGKSVALLIPDDLPDEMTSILDKIRAGQHIDHFETTRVTRDGTLFLVSLSVSPIRDTDGAIVGASSIERDVTRQIEAAESARSMIEASLDPLVAISPEGRITDANEATVKVTGFAREELIGTAFSNYFTDPDKANAIYRRVFSQGPVLDSPLTIRHRDGTHTDVRYNASGYRGTGGTVLAVFAAARDITELQRGFEAARSMIESSLDSLVSISPEGRITDANAATVKLTGVPREELIGTAFSDYFTDSEKANAIYQRVFSEGTVVDYPLTIRHRDGKHTDVLYNASVQRANGGTVLGVFAAARDLTRLMEAFGAARAMIESSLDSLVSIGPDGRITDANEATVNLTGASREELIGTAFSDYFTDPEKANAIYHLVLAHGTAVDYPLTMRHRDGTLTEVLYNASVYRDVAGEVLGVFAAARDVTKQRKAGAQYARSLIEAALDPLVTISPEGKINDVNEATVRATGIAREELIGTDFSHYFTEPEKAHAGYERAFAQGSVTDFPLTLRHRDGSLIDVLYNASVYLDTNGDVLGVCAAARDVTEQKRAQTELARHAIELERLDELERFHRMTVGRELKMIELKKEIESLRRLVQADERERGDQD